MLGQAPVPSPGGSSTSEFALGVASCRRFVLKSSPSSRILERANDLMGELPEGCLAGAPA